jgi:hypothetical protein
MLYLGLNGQKLGPSGAYLGFSAMEILPDGAFLVSGGGQNDFYSFRPVADPASGLAELTLIPLAIDPAIIGTVTGLDYVRRVTPSDLLGDIEGIITAGGLESNKGKSLVSKINVVQKMIDDGKIAQAINVLDAFINQINGYINGENITAEDGQILIDRATDLIQQLQD